MEIVSAIVIIASLILTITTNTNIECKIVNEEQITTMEDKNVQEEKRTDQMPTDV